MILEELDGFVECIRGETAFLTLRSKSGEEFLGEYAAEDLAKLGIKENRRFKCQTIVENGKPDIRLFSIPDVEISPEVEKEINERINNLTKGL